MPGQGWSVVKGAQLLVSGHRDVVAVAGTLVPVALDGMAEVAGNPGHLGIDVFGPGHLTPLQNVIDGSMAGEAAPCIPTQARIRFDFGKEFLEVLGLKDGVGE